MMWREQKDHILDCYFCKVGKPKNSNRQTLKKIVYPDDVDSATRPVPHSDEVPVPSPPSVLPSLDDLVDLSTCSSDEDYEIEDAMNNQPKRWNQAQLNDYVRDMEMSKDKSEISASRFREMGWLENGVTVSHFRKRTDDLKPFFTQEGKYFFTINFSCVYSFACLKLLLCKTFMYDVPLYLL